MTDTYDNSSSEESRYAVAQLMSDVGIASDMGYSPLSSGANSISSLQGWYNISVTTQVLFFYNATIMG